MRCLRKHVPSVIRTAVDEAHASIQASVRRHRSARTEAEADSELAGVLLRAVLAVSYMCSTRARPAAAARQVCRTRSDPRFCRRELLSLQRGALPSRLAAGS